MAQAAERLYAEAEAPGSASSDFAAVIEAMRR